MFALADRRTGRLFSAPVRSLDLRKVIVVIPDHAPPSIHDRRPRLPVVGRPSDIYGNVAVSLPHIAWLYGRAA